MVTKPLPALDDASRDRPRKNKKATLTTTASAAIKKSLFVIEAKFRGVLTRIGQSHKTHDGAEGRNDHEKIEERKQVENQAVVFGN